MKTTLLSITLVLASLPAAETALACSCVVPPPPQEALNQSSAVFAGNVLGITRLGTSLGGELEVRIRVDRRWKGANSSHVTLRTATNSAACGYHFVRGESYLIYAHRDGSLMRTNICTRTQVLKDAGEDLAALGDGEVVVEPDEGGCGGPSNVGAMQAMLFLGLGAALLRRRTFVQ